MKKNKLIGSFMLFGTVLTLSACSVLDNFGGNIKSEDKTSESSKADSTSTSTSNEKSSKSEKQKKELERLRKKFGKLYDTGFQFESIYNVKVNNVKFEENENSEGDPNKNKIAIVNVTVGNGKKNGEVIKLDPSDFIVVSGNQKIPVNSDIEGDNKLQVKDLAKGEESTGNLYFEVPENGGLELNYNPKEWQNWTLKVKLR